MLSHINKGYCIENYIPGVNSKLVWTSISSIKKAISQEADLCDQKVRFGLYFKQKSWRDLGSWVKWDIWVDFLLNIQIIQD